MLSLQQRAINTDQKQNSQKINICVMISQCEISLLDQNKILQSIIYRVEGKNLLEQEASIIKYFS